MQDLFQEEMTDQEFQFCKEQLKVNVKMYLDMDDQIKALNKAIVERRKKKNELSEEILGTMKKFEIDNMNTQITAKRLKELERAESKLEALEIGDNDGIILMLALRMAQQSCYPEAYEKFCEAYNYMIDVRSLDLPKEELIHE